jgi:hypothetical protein
MSKTKTTHLAGRLGGSVQTGLVPYSLCGKRTKFSPSLVDYMSEHGPKITCKECARLALAELELEIANAKKTITKNQIELDRLMPIWRKYVGTKPTKPSEF